jgi:DNA-binding response OmpR family regulator
MRLECLIVTCDSNLLSHIKSNFGTSGASLDFRQDSASAIELASRRHFDAVFIDCDDVGGGTEVLTKTRNSRSNQQTLIFAVTSGSTSVENAVDLGANFVLCKPVQETRLRSVLDIAIPKMEREHRRYFRYDSDLPVRFGNHLGQSFTARMKNVSEGGLAVSLVDRLHLKGVLTLEFELPSVTPQRFHARADVVWSDCFTMGLRFLYIEKNSEVALQGWLKSLDAQSQLNESNARPC